MSDKVLATMTREEAQALSEKMAQLHPGLEWEVAQETRERIRLEDGERMLARLSSVGLPAPSVEAPALTERKALVAHMAAAGVKAGNTQAHHQGLWRHLYSQLEHRHGTDLRTRAKNAGAVVLDLAETLGLIPTLYALACELWPNGAAADARELPCEDPDKQLLPGYGVMV